MRRIEARLARGSINHLRSLNNKAIAVKNNNEIVDKINHEFKELLKEQEKQTRYMFVQRYSDKHEKVKEVREVLQIHKQSQSKL